MSERDTQEDEDNEDKAARQKRARKDKQDLINKSAKFHSYAVYRRAGLRPWCALRLWFVEVVK